jgi:hypothetical protein
MMMQTGLYQLQVAVDGRQSPEGHGDAESAFDKPCEKTWLVGQDGILRPIGNRPVVDFSKALGRPIDNQIDNRPQVTNLPHIWSEACAPMSCL